MKGMEAEKLAEVYCVSRTVGFSKKAKNYIIEDVLLDYNISKAW